MSKQSILVRCMTRKTQRVVWVMVCIVISLLSFGTFVLLVMFQMRSCAVPIATNLQHYKTSTDNTQAYNLNLTTSIAAKKDDTNINDNHRHTFDRNITYTIPLLIDGLTWNRYFHATAWYVI